MVPPDPVKSPFTELRLNVPIKLTTDPCNAGGHVSLYTGFDFRDSDSFDSILEGQSELTSAS
jgi:hypothetical protein